MKTISAHQIKLPEETVDNIRLIVDNRFQGIKIYCLQRGIDITDYLHAFKWGAFPHKLIAQFLDDKILVQSQAYIFNSYPDLVDCALHRLKRESGETRFCMEYEIPTLTYLSFFNKYIFDAKMHEALIFAGFWKDAVATVYNIPSEILTFPTMITTMTPQESLDFAKECLYNQKEEKEHRADKKREILSKTQQEPITEEPQEAPELTANPEPEAEPESQQEEPKTQQTTEPPAEPKVKKTRGRRPKKAEPPAEQPAEPAVIKTQQEEPKTQQEEPPKLIKSKEEKTTEELQAEILVLKKRLEAKERISVPGIPRSPDAHYPPDDAPKLRRQLKKGDKYAHSSDYVETKYFKDLQKYGQLIADIRRIIHQHYGVLPHFCELYGVHYRMLWKHITGAQFSLPGAQALKICGVIPHDLLVEFYQTNYPKNYRYQTEFCV